MRKLITKSVDARAKAKQTATPEIEIQYEEARPHVV
jgi:hypothetical protein